MKKATSIVLLGAALASCAGSGSKGYEIKGSYADSIMDQKTVFLMAGDSIIDSTQVQGRDFAFQGSVDSAAIYRVASKVSVRGQEFYNTLSDVILKNGVQVNMTVTDKVVIEDNGGDNQIWNDFIEKFRAENEKDMEEYGKLMEAGTSRDSIMLFVDAARKKAKTIWTEAANSNKENIAGALILSKFCNEFETASEFETFVQGFKYSNMFPEIVKQRAYYQQLEKSAEGQMFIDFEGKDLQGNVVKFSDFIGKGKYVLVDFWASWCGPCRGEIPNILAVNKKYKGDNFMVLGVDVWDKMDDFKKALEEEKIDYAQMFASETKDATELYAIKGIPQIMLFGPDGTILKRNLRGDAIGATVKEFLKK